MFEELYRAIPLGDREVICRNLNEEFAYYFTRKGKPQNKIEYVTIDEKLVFQFMCQRSSMFVQLQCLDDDGNIIIRKNHMTSKTIALTTFIFDYCNPEGLIVMEKAFLNYI
jgi:hypothetical protein